MSGRTGIEPWWRTAVVYQVYPRSFADADGDGVGDLRGVIQRLDHLQSLGVDVLWLSPVYPSPQVDNGYDISDYQDVDPLFGTLADLDELVAGLHERGMRLVLDLVVNHTSSQHPWFVASRSSREDLHRDWYWWRPARPGTEPGTPGAEPTNWRSFFSGPAWTFDPRTGEYYLHLFAAAQPDLNWENPEVRRAVHAMMRWWLDRGVDGFRMDVVNFVSKDPALPDGRIVAGPGGATPDGLADGSAAYVCGPRIHEFLAEMHREVFADRPGTFLTVGEMPGVTVDEARLFTDPARREVDMVFQFEHVGVDHGATKWDRRPLHLPALKAIMARWQAGLADAGWNSLYWCNHDQPRVVSRFGDDGVHRAASAKVLATVLHLHRGTPYVYQGEELGLPNASFPTPQDLRDVESLNHYRAEVAAGRDPDEVLAEIRPVSRDNARTPMPWDGGPNAGFSPAGATPWIDIPAAHLPLNAAAQRDDPASVFAHYRRLVELRHTEPVVAVGDFTMLLPEHPSVYAFTRELDGVRLLVLAHLGAGDVVVEVPDGPAWSGAEVLVGSGGGAAPALVVRDGTWRPGPWDAVVLRRRP